MNLAKQSECIYYQKSNEHSEANMFILKNLKIEVKRRWLILNFESSEEKRT
jgi:hypothetical protein